MWKAQPYWSAHPLTARLWSTRQPSRLYIVWPNPPDPECTLSPAYPWTMFFYHSHIKPLCARLYVLKGFTRFKSSRFPRCRPLCFCHSLMAGDGGQKRRFYAFALLSVLSCLFICNLWSVSSECRNVCRPWAPFPQTPRECSSKHFIAEVKVLAFVEFPLNTVLRLPWHTESSQCCLAVRDKARLGFRGCPFKSFSCGRHFFYREAWDLGIGVACSFKYDCIYLNVRAAWNLTAVWSLTAGWIWSLASFFYWDMWGGKAQ